MLAVIVDEVVPAGTTKLTDISAYGETLNISILIIQKPSELLLVKQCEHAHELATYLLVLL
jgi:hypothetical protein